MIRSFMKYFILTAAFLISSSIFAQTLSCLTTTDMTTTKRLISFDEKMIDIEGSERKPILQVVKAAIDGKALKKCLNKSPEAQYKCLSKLVPDAKDGDSRMSMHNVLLQISELEPDPKGSVGMVSGLDVATKLDIQISDVASGIVYVLKFGTYYPNSGLYEFFDREGKSLGKFYLEAFARNCR
jgi:hypothetical protein